MEITEGLTFDDVLLVPKRSAIASRRDVDLTSNLTPRIQLHIPFVSANMDTVTESQMAIAMARKGGMGFIHRFLPIEIQAEEIRKVKRSENYVVEKPYTVYPETTLKEIKKLVVKNNVQAFLVSDPESHLIGILTKRDYFLEEDLDKKVSEMMTPKEKIVTGKSGTTLEQAKYDFRKYKIEKLPLIDEAGKIVGLITAKDIEHCLNPLAVRDNHGRLRVAGAVGVKSDYLDRANALIEAGVDALVVDIAHGHLESSLNAISKLKQEHPETEIISGNVVTESGARDMISAGSDCIKIGVGPGSSCKTRIVAGTGVPQLTAIQNVRKGAGDKPIIADGGIRNSGDAVKALAAGANIVMCGNLFAGTDEAPGEIITWNNKRAKLFRGMASMSAYLDKPKDSSDQDLVEFVSEGADNGVVPYRGSVKEVLDQLSGGIRSGFSYSGAKDINELWQKAEFIHISSASRKENGIHDMSI